MSKSGIVTSYQPHSNDQSASAALAVSSAPTPYHDVSEGVYSREEMQQQKIDAVSNEMNKRATNLGYGLGVALQEMGLAIKRMFGLEVDHGYTELHIAVLEGDLEKIEKSDRDLRGVQDNNGDTAMHLAAREASYETVWKLYFSKPYFFKAINMKNNDGDTPLHLAAKRMDKDGARIAILLLNKANVLLENNENHTADELTQKPGVYFPIRRKKDLFGPALANSAYAEPESEVEPEEDVIKKLPRP